MEKDTLVEKFKAASQDEEQFKRHFLEGHSKIQVKFAKDKRVDLRSKNVLLEFKVDKGELTKVNKYSKAVLAQALAYCRLIYVKDKDYMDQTLPGYIGLVDPDEGVLLPVHIVLDVVTDDALWPDSFTPSNTETYKKVLNKLNDVMESLWISKETLAFRFSDDTGVNEFYEVLLKADASKGKGLDIGSPITARNIHNVASAWLEEFGDYFDKENVANKAHYFKEDALGNAARVSLKDGYRFGALNGAFNIPPAKYDSFWRKYKRPAADVVLDNIMQFSYVLMDDTERARTGAFNTDTRLAAELHKEMDRCIPEWREPGHVVYDPCAGTGNMLLGAGIPANQLILSTLDDADVKQLKLLPDFNGAEIFQADFLSVTKDNVGSKKGHERLAKCIREQGENMTIIMNPPYADTGDKQLTKKATDKTGVSKTDVKAELQKLGCGKAANELFVQFLYHCKVLFPKANIAVLSTMKYILKTDCRAFRNKVWNYQYMGGIICDASEWFVSSEKKGKKTVKIPIGKFPIIGAVWKPNGVLPEKYDFRLVTKKGGDPVTMSFYAYEDYINGWIDRPRCNVPGSDKNPHGIPLQNAIEVKHAECRLQANAAGGFGYMTVLSPSLQDQNGNRLTSASAHNANGCAITPTTCEKCLLTTGFMQSVDKSWSTEVLSLQVPLCDHKAPSSAATKLDPVDKLDTIVYALFCAQNLTAAFNADYKKWKGIKIDNQFYPYTVAEVKSWFGKVTARFLPGTADKDTYTAAYLENNKQHLSAEAQAVLDAGKEVYQAFYAHWCNNDGNPAEAKLQYYNSGLYQVRKYMLTVTGDRSVYDAAVAKMKTAVKVLRTKVQGICRAQRVY